MTKISVSDKTAYLSKRLSSYIHWENLKELVEEWIVQNDIADLSSVSLYAEIEYEYGASYTFLELSATREATPEEIKKHEAETEARFEQKLKYQKEQYEELKKLFE